MTLLLPLRYAKVTQEAAKEGCLQNPKQGCPLEVKFGFILWRWVEMWVQETPQFRCWEKGSISGFLVCDAGGIWLQGWDTVGSTVTAAL